MPRFDNLDKAMRLLRRLDGRSQAEIAEAAGVTAAMLSNYETGMKTPSVASLGKILDGLGVSLQRLEDALDVVNDRRTGSGALLLTGQRQAPAAPQRFPSFSIEGGGLAPDLELGLYEISRGLERAQGRSNRGPR